MLAGICAPITWVFCRRDGIKGFVVWLGNIFIYGRGIFWWYENRGC